MFRIGIDCGSTTIKVVVLDKDNKIVYKNYLRHNADIILTLHNVLEDIIEKLGNVNVRVTFTGSAGFKIAESLGIKHTQEVVAATTAIMDYLEGVDVCIELGGEDAKIIFFDGVNPEQRMNGACAGGTGAFVDQMATLLDTDPIGVNNYAKSFDKIYPIAARCGVFAKTDVQPLLNQGVSKENISASIFQAVVNQTLTGLAQGKKVTGKVCFLGGPLTFLSELRNRFIDTLSLTDDNVVLPENSEVFIALGAALNCDNRELTISEFLTKVDSYKNNKTFSYKKVLPRLFNNQEEVDTFLDNHSRHSVETRSLEDYKGKAYLGIDCGSTTTKVILLSEDNKILFQYYSSNKGNPVDVIKRVLKDLYDQLPEGVVIAGSCSTGYGELLIKNAYNLDKGMVETICHYTASKFFMPEVDFIIDIGGQDMKCFKITNNHISSIILNEACSSGCGSFIETFASALGYGVKDFANIALLAENPVDLGSKCTVFMNSSVKSAQKDGASPADISAGLAYSVIKNALYKVIRVNNVIEDCGRNIIVQGGTFYNNAILRAFEKETNANVVRPNIAGLMGAFGAALIAKEMNKEKSSIISKEELESFTYKSSNVNCNKCPNNCLMTVNIFNDKRYISGNRCELGLGKRERNHLPNLYEFKYNTILSYERNVENAKGTIGIPVVLNMYENLPFWSAFFNALKYNVKLSPRSTKELYEYGQTTIPSDTACYPAKIVHGHIEYLKEDTSIDYIFYPNMPFNVKEKNHVQNHFNCPVVASYPELISANVPDLNNFIMPYLAIGHVSKKEHKQIENDVFVDRIYKELKQYIKVSKGDIKKAYARAITELQYFKNNVRAEGERAIKYARVNNLQIMVLAGRPYHIDPEINHGIDMLLTSLGCVVVSEDSISHLADHTKKTVLNQWSYHTRLYDAAKWVTENKDANLVQLVSFGCGLDAITTDEVNEVLTESGKFYTQLKIDEISNLGAVTIRIRSLLESLR